MKYLALLRANLARKKLRTTLTLLSILVAFFLFGLLGAVNRAFGMGVELAGLDRLVMIHKVSLIQPLPIAYLSRIQATEGVAAATHATWFGGTYQDPKNFFGKFPIDPEGYLAMYPELVLPAEQKEAFFHTRTGAIAGRALADRFGWKVGDKIPIIPDIWRKKDGGNWEFDLVGIYDGAEKGTDETQFLFHYDYFDEARVFGQGIVGWYVIRVEDPEQAAAVAARLDAQFENSASETKTTTEKAFAQGFANQVGNIGAILRAILAAVFFTILLVAGTTMSQAVRERVGEIGVLKALGFTNQGVLGLVLAESLLVALLGAGFGLLFSLGAVPILAKAVGAFLPITHVPGESLAVGAVFAVVLGLAAGLPPALGAMRLTIVDALRRA